jgi:hypothetical protein
MKEHPKFNFSTGKLGIAAKVSQARKLTRFR